MDGSTSRLLFIYRRWPVLSRRQRFLIYMVILQDAIIKSRIAIAAASGIFAAATVYIFLEGGWLGFFAGCLVGYYVSSARVSL